MAVVIQISVHKKLKITVMKYSLLFCMVASIICNSAHAQSGSLDTRFGEEGIVIKSFGNTATGIPDIINQKDGKILTSIFVFPDLLYLYRFNPDGSPDLDFATNGVSITIIKSATDLALQQDGKILVVGSASTGSGYQFRRFLPNGQVDSAFGINGTKAGTFGGVSTFTNDIEIQDDGKIVSSGTFSEFGTRSDIFIARFLPDGNVDSSFGDE